MALPVAEGDFFIVDQVAGILDSLGFGRLPVGYALQHVPDGSPAWALANQRLPAANAPRRLSLGLRINEAKRRNGPDWLGLFNPEPRPGR